MDNVKTAKISAAFKACKVLYSLGELNERFVPKTLKERVASIADVHFEHWNKYGDSGGFTRTRIRYVYLY